MAQLTNIQQSGATNPYSVTCDSDATNGSDYLGIRTDRPWYTTGQGANDDIHAIIDAAHNGVSGAITVAQVLPFSATPTFTVNAAPSGYVALVNDGLLRDMALEFTLSVDLSLTLPITAGNAYDYTVDWGDATAIEHFTDATLPTHTYAAAGTYVVRLRGLMEGISFSGAADSPKLTRVPQIGGTGLNTAYRMFKDTVNVTEVLCPSADCVDFTLLNSAGEFAWGATALHTVESRYWQMSRVTSISELVRDTQVRYMDVELWDTPILRNAERVWLYCQGMKLQNWNAAAIRNATNMLLSGKLETVDYDQLLINWAAQTTEPDTTINFGETDTKYSAGAAATARASLVTRGWTITDGGQV